MESASSALNKTRYICLNLPWTYDNEGNLAVQLLGVQLKLPIDSATLFDRVNLIVELETECPPSPNTNPTNSQNF
jgi:hypothetical protein